MQCGKLNLVLKDIVNQEHQIALYNLLKIPEKSMTDTNKQKQ